MAALNFNDIFKELLGQILILDLEPDAKPTFQDSWLHPLVRSVQNFNFNKEQAGAALCQAQLKQGHKWN